jgi:O-antigen ligase
LRALIYVVVSTGVASALFGVVRQARQGEETGFLLPYLQPGRGYGQFINYNHFAFLMEMTLGLLTGLIVGGIVHHHRHRRLRLFIYSAALVLAWTALMLSRSRGGVFGMLGQVVFLGLMFRAVRSPHKHHKHRSRIAGRLQRVGRALAVRVILVAFLMIVMAFGLAWVGGEPLANRMGRLSDEVSEEELGEHAGPRRLHFWAATWKLFKARPVAGSGFGSYWVAIDGYYDDAGNSTPQQAHNDYLELLASGGLIGMALAVWFVFLFIRRARECLRSESSSRRAACFGALAGIFAIAIHSAVDFGLHATANALVFTTLIVIATVRCGDDEHSAEHRGGLKLASIFSSSSDLIAHLIPSRRIRRLIAVLVCLTACILGIWTVARIGLSRLHSDSAAEDRLLASADKAVRLTPSDPVAHFVRAGVLFEDEQFKGALDEYERAVALRPGDHVLWLGLGFARERNGDEQGALAAFGQAVRLAPYYASQRAGLHRTQPRRRERPGAFASSRRSRVGRVRRRSAQGTAGHTA